MKNFLICLRFFILSAFLGHCLAWEAGLGLYKEIDDVQDKSGDEQSLPYNLQLALGNTFNLTPTLVFSPYIGYVKHRNVSDDSYGKFDVTTWSLIYDFLWAPGMSASSGYSIRYGIGTFIRKFEGDGGTVTVPNGSSGSSTAHRPKKSDSYTMSFNLGAETYFRPIANFLKATGARAELFTFHPLNGEKRSFSFNVMLMGYF